jgi:hypothetical protein
MKSILYLNKEKMYQENCQPGLINGKQLYCAPITIALEDKFYPENDIEKRIISALSKTGRTYYHVIWDPTGNDSTVYYIKFSSEV